MDEIVRNLQRNPQEVVVERLRSLPLRLGMAWCLMPATIGTNEFFCLSCRLTGELDLHGRCAACGSDAVTHPLRYQLNLLEAGECIREKKLPLAVSLEDGKDFNCNFAVKRAIKETQNDKFGW